MLSITEVVRSERETSLAAAEEDRLDRGTILRLEEIRVPTDVVRSASNILQDVVRPEEQYVRTFRDYGIDIVALETDEAANASGRAGFPSRS